ncbi:MAG: rhomboid family intramembrane serine protease [Flavobacterium sp.]|nr:rhomboid family intramembrane serine protease [Flavobacterium sp.]
MNDNYFKFSSSVITIPFLFVLFLWIVFWAGIKFNVDLELFGIYPRTFFGLIGVVSSPFIHGNIEHLYNNSIPLLILLASLRYFYREQSIQILGYGILFSGILTWIIGRESYHIGASGLIYVLVSFIFFKGIRTKYYRLVALSLLVIMLYGSMIWYVFPHVEEGISWEGHLAGLITGFAFSVLFKTTDYKKLIRYEWEQPDYDPQTDKFMQRFDENGNFVNLPKPEIVQESISNIDSSSSEYFVEYDSQENKYIIKKKE